MKITYYGHSCVELESKGIKVMVDPFISGNALAGKIDISKLNPNYILLTHAHYDHILDAETIAKQCNAKILSNPEITNYYGNKKIETISMNVGGVFSFGSVGEVKMLQAIHSSSFPDGTYGGLACGYLFKFENRVVYIAGDTALTYDFKLLPFIYGFIDLAVLPIGGNYTMGIEDAITASKFMKVKTILGCHYDTFPVIKIDHVYAKKKFKEEEKELILLSIGKDIQINFAQEI